MDDYSINALEHKKLLEILFHGGTRRITDLTFAINYRYHALQVEGYHLVNMVVHLTVSVIIYAVINTTISALKTSFLFQENAAAESTFAEKFMPFAVALLFVSHPIQTQAVTYIIQRYTSLATLFYLLSILFFLKGRLSYVRREPCSHPLLYGGLSLVTGILAIGSKEIAVTLPLMLLFLEMYLFRGRLINRRLYISCGALVLLGLCLVLIAWHNNSLDGLLFDLRHATAEDNNTSRATYFLTQTRVLVTYLRLLCLPYGQNLIHNYQIYTSLFSAPVIASLALHITLIMVAGVLFMKSRQNLLSGDWPFGAYQRLASFGIIWFYVASLVESSIFPIRHVIFEHRIYLPSVGFFLTLSAITALTTNRWKTGNRIAWTLTAIICLVLGGLTIARNHVWSDRLAFWQDSVQKSPNNYFAMSNLAGEYLHQNMPDKAIPLYVQAIEQYRGLSVSSQVGFGQALQRLHIFGERLTTGEELLTGDTGIIDYSNLPKLGGIQCNNLGLANEYLGEPQKALYWYRMAIDVNPTYDLAWYNLGLLASRLGDQVAADNALSQLKKLNASLANSLALARDTSN